MSAVVLLIAILIPFLGGFVLFGAKEWSYGKLQIVSEILVIITSLLVCLILFGRPEAELLIFQLTGNKYPAVKRALRSNTTGPSQQKTLTSDAKAPLARYHLLKKPANGGIPTNDNDPRVKQARVIGICRPIPRSSDTLVFPL